jgi:hypothetical protein
VNDGPSVSPLKYTPSRDLAIFELRYSLPHHHSVPFSLDDLDLQVDIFTYPKEAISPFRSLLSVSRHVQRANHHRLPLPVQSLVAFVSKVQPCLAQSIFPSTMRISLVSADLYPKFVPPPRSDALRHRPEEPVEVTALCNKAQLLADSMCNSIGGADFCLGIGRETARRCFRLRSSRP